MITANTLGAPNWVDLATTDVGGAIDFYRELLGWEMESATTPVGNYHIGKRGHRQVAGIMAIPEHEAMFPLWTTFIYVEDVDLILERVVAAGGTILQQPLELPEGRVAVVADPTGAMFGVLSGVAAEGTWFSQDPGSVCWVELLTRDTVIAEAFYAEVFGWKAETQIHGLVPYTMFSLDGDLVAGMMPMPAEVPDEAPSTSAVYYALD